jgi:putative toxin-antitoxin system antitoxin component (TIGR02293 family)
VTGRTAQRRRQTGVLSAEESDRLVRAAHLVRRAIDTFGDEAVARSWLMRPNRALGARRPLDLLGSELEAVAVEATLGRVEFGDFS